MQSRSKDKLLKNFNSPIGLHITLYYLNQTWLLEYVLLYKSISPATWMLKVKKSFHFVEMAVERPHILLNNRWQTM